MVVGSEARAYRTKPCKFYRHDGQCKKGSECVFQHINPETGEDEHERLSLAEGLNEGEDDQQEYADTLDQFAGEVEDDAQFDSQGGSSGQDAMDDEENKIKCSPLGSIFRVPRKDTRVVGRAPKPTVSEYAAFHAAGDYCVCWRQTI